MVDLGLNHVVRVRVPRLVSMGGFNNANANLKLDKRVHIAMDTLESTRVAALATIRRCATPHGLYASAPPDGYTMVFARDSMITLLGARFEDAPFVCTQFKKSLETLAMHQSPTGQIPNAVDRWDPKRPKNDSFATVDSTLWWLIGFATYATRFKDKAFAKRFDSNAQKAFQWLACQDTGEDS
ncbi:MAG: amylo-alpha-1,6-glucosidase, partial [Candidatus Diapherotrites archaeon]|nr:amylo-alpha-1,6-glucosidase [Candidatus Diapherotrites archaeon]